MIPTTPSGLVEAMVAALDLPALAEVRDRLVHLVEFPLGLFRVDVETVPGPALKCRVSLQLSDAGRDLAAALGAGEVDPGVVEKALGHAEISSVGLHCREDGASAEGSGTAPPTDQAAFDPRATPQTAYIAGLRLALQLDRANDSVRVRLLKHCAVITPDRAAISAALLDAAPEIEALLARLDHVFAAKADRQPEVPTAPGCPW